MARAQVEPEKAPEADKGEIEDLTADAIVKSDSDSDSDKEQEYNDTIAPDTKAKDVWAWALFAI